MNYLRLNIRNRIAFPFILKGNFFVVEKSANRKKPDQRDEKKN
jgi:hypothetical protein